MTPDRAQRVADFVRTELADIIQRDMRDPRVAMLSVTDARVSRDLAFADIYVSSLAVADEAGRRQLVEVLGRAGGFLRSAIAKRQRWRTTPRLRFHYDDSLAEGARLDALIDQAIEADDDATAKRSPRESAARILQEEQADDATAKRSPRESAARILLEDDAATAGQQAGARDDVVGTG